MAFSDSQDQYSHERGCGAAKNKVAKNVVPKFGDKRIAKSLKRRTGGEVAASCA
jgi:hypothetical protein